MKRFKFLALFLAAFPFAVFAQQTGSFHDIAIFNGESRTLSFYVPANYDSTQSYRLMIGLHGAGDNSNNYRDALVQNNLFVGQMPNTIFVFPGGGDDPSGNFHAPEGDEEIIAFTLDYVDEYYNIDTTDVILQGFSLGGRSALLYGLDHPEMFRGLILSTPALQGIKDALGQSVDTPDYANAPNLRIYITHGSEDVLYTGPIDTMYRELVMNDGVAALNRIAGMGHSVPGSATPLALDFIYNADSSANDAEILAVHTPLNTCTGTDVPVSVLVRNTGSQTDTSISFEYTVGTSTQTHTWTGSLSSFEHALISLPNVAASADGINNIDVEITAVNGVADDQMINNTGTGAFQASTQATAIPYAEGFDDLSNFPPQNWVIKRSGDYILPWTQDTDLKKDSTAAMMSMNTIVLFDNINRREEIMSPVLDLTGISNPELSFDVAFNYVRITPPYVTADLDLSDTLEILVSTDCGQSFTSVYKKAGDDLSTFSTPMLNPFSVEAHFIQPDASNWRKERIALGDFSSSTEAIIKFSYISGIGGCIAIDNFSVSAPTKVEETPVAHNITLYPNPASAKVFIRSEQSAVQSVNIYDLSGKAVLTQTGETMVGKLIELNTSTLNSGIYMVEIVTDKAVAVEKLVIE